MAPRPRITARITAPIAPPREGPCAGPLWARIALPLAAAGLGACGPSPGPASTPARGVILITCDTLRADRLGVYGYGRGTSPNLDALARGAIVFDQAWSTAPLTLPALTSIMTGRLPDEVGVGAGNRSLIPAEVVTLAERLSAAGIPTAAVVSNWVLRSQGVGVGLEQGFEHFDDRMTLQEVNRKHLFERLAPDTTAAALGWLAGRGEPGREPFFLWVHYQDPHGPYTPPEDIARRFDGAAGGGSPGGESALPLGNDQRGLGQIPAYQALGDARHPDLYRDRYDAEIHYFDQALGTLLDGLREGGLFEDSLILFTADHGESLGENGWWFCHGDNLQGEVLHVPLILKPPGAAGRTPARAPRSDRVVSHLDLAPTVLEALGVPVTSTPGAPTLGCSLLSRPPPEGRLALQSLGRPGSPRRVEGVCDGRQRLVLSAHSGPHLYDVRADPGETRDLAARHPERVRELMGRAAEVWRGIGTGIEGLRRPLDEQDERAFEGLGYAGGADEDG